MCGIIAVLLVFLIAVGCGEDEEGDTTISSSVRQLAAIVDGHDEAAEQVLDNACISEPPVDCEGMAQLSLVLAIDRVRSLDVILAKLTDPDNSQYVGPGVPAEVEQLVTSTREAAQAVDASYQAYEQAGCDLALSYYEMQELGCDGSSIRLAATDLVDELDAWAPYF